MECYKNFYKLSYNNSNVYNNTHTIHNLDRKYYSNIDAYSYNYLDSYYISNTNNYSFWIGDCLSESDKFK